MMKTGYNERITIYLNNERFRYHTHEIISAFFNAETAEYIDYGQAMQDGLFLKLETKEEAEDFDITISIFQNREMIKEHNFKVSEKPVFSDGKDAPLLNKARRILKSELYDFMSEICDRKLPWGSMTGIRPAKVVNTLSKTGMTRDQIREELTVRYSMSEKKADLAIQVADTQSMMLKNTHSESDINSIALYIGIPFCPTRCLYCSFTSNPINKYKKVVNDYIDTLIFEMEQTAELIKQSRYNIESIYMGGGTPTSLNSDELERLLEAVCHIWKIENHKLKEFCVEAGRPDSIDRDKLRVLKAKGITRISINPQTLNDCTLEIIGRKHTSKQFIESFEMAREEGFDNINVDIIAGLPGETFEMFDTTLNGVLALNPENITVHTMSVKRASDLKLKSGEYVLTDGSIVEKMISRAYKDITAQGLKPFYMYRQKNMLGNLENVSYSKQGYESYYNVHIMEEDQTIIAFGAGAVSKFVKARYEDSQADNAMARYEVNQADNAMENIIERAFNVKSVEDYLKRKEDMVDRKRNFVYNYLVE